MGPSLTGLEDNRPDVEARDLLVSNLTVIDRAVSFVCRRHRLDVDEAEEFAAVVRLKLVENDYAILRKFERRSTFATFVSIVIQRLLLDYRIHLWGKWHSSAEARRLGDTAMELERLLHRDGRTFDEAATILNTVPRETLQTIASRLPERGPKRRIVAVEEAETAAAVREPDLSFERNRVANTISCSIRQYIEQISGDERLILQLRFESGMTVAQIARSLHQDQKQLYRLIDKHLRNLRESLESAGIAAADVAEVIGDRGTLLEFNLRNRDLRPSNEIDDVAAGEEEVSR